MEGKGTQGKNFFSLDGKKKKTVTIGLIALFLVSIIGCRTVDAQSSRALGYNSIMGSGNTAVAAKDFEPLGIVFAESTASRRNGYGTTYDALMKEAVQKGADAIINVNITPTSGVFKKTWSGSALAIKYLDTTSPIVSTDTSVSLFNGLANTALSLRSGRGFRRNWF